MKQVMFADLHLELVSCCRLVMPADEAGSMLQAGDAC